MTQQKKPEKKQEIEYDPDNASWGNADDSYSHGSDVGEVYGFNQAIEEMEAYYQPIVMELLEVLEDIVNWDDVSHPNHTSLKYPFLKAKQALAKYKELK